MTKENWQPEILAGKLNKLKLRSKLIASIREFFTAQDFLEVETPILQTSPGAEIHTHAFSTTLHGAFGENPRELYLNTSPEFAMKKLLVAGLPKIFQITKAFRNQEFSPFHQPEFTMLEWYRAGASYLEIMQDCEELIKHAARICDVREIECLGHKPDLFKTWERLSLQNCFLKYCDLDLESCLQDRQKFASKALRIGVNISLADAWDDIFFKVFLDKIEPYLGIKTPTIIYDYPIEMAALSRPKPLAPQWAERFEIYIGGLELANAFGELTDPKIQAQRFQEDGLKRLKLYGQKHPIDTDFLAALEYGMPQSAGIALGIDRLALLFTNASCLKEVLWLPIEEKSC